MHEVNRKGNKMQKYTNTRQKEGKAEEDINEQKKRERRHKGVEEGSIRIEIKGKEREGERDLMNKEEVKE